MGKREKPTTKIQDQTLDNPDDRAINALIEKRKLQQEALKKIMSSIDSVENKHAELTQKTEKRKSKIQKIFSTDRKTK